MRSKDCNPLKRALFAGSLWCASTGLLASEKNTELELIIGEHGFKGETLYVQVFEAKQMGQKQSTWPEEPSKRYKFALGSQSSVVLTEMQKGSIAIRAFIDLDLSGKLTRNKKSRPAEPFAFSSSKQGARLSLNFSKAVINLEQTRNKAYLRLRVPKKLVNHKG